MRMKKVNPIAGVMTEQDFPKQGSISFGKHSRELGKTFKEVLDEIMGKYKSK